MKRLKQIGLCLVLTLGLGMLLWMAYPSFWEDCVQSASTGRQSVQYVKAAVSEEGLVAAIGRQDGVWSLTMGDSRGRDRSLTLEKLGMGNVNSVGELFVCADGSCILSVYETRDQLLCAAYYIAPGGKTAQQILSIPCQGGTREDARLFGFAEEEGETSFLLEHGGEMAVYAYAAGEPSARKLKDLTAQQAENALYALAEGEVALVTADSLDLGGDKVALPGGVSPIDGWHGEKCAYLLDGSEGALWRVDTVNGKGKKLLTLEPDAGIIDLSVSADGRVALLDDEGTLQLWRDGAAQDYSDMLYRPRWMSIAFLAAAALAVVLVALILWYILWELRKMKISLVVRYGVSVAAVLALLTAAAVRWVVYPHYQIQAEASAQTNLRSAALVAPEPVVDPLGVSWDFDPDLTTRAEFIYSLWRAFGSPQVPERAPLDDVAPDSPYWPAVEWALTYNITGGTGPNQFGPDMTLNEEQAFTFLYRAMRYIGSDRMTLAEEDGVLYRIESDGGKTALSALMLGESFRQGAMQALETGSAFAGHLDGGAEYYVCFSSAGAGRLSVVSAEAEPYRVMARQGAEATAKLLWGAAVMVLALMVAVLTALSRSLNRVTRGMAAIQNGCYVEVIDRGGDEVGAMADSLNSMARSLRDADAQEVHRGDMYARFLPHQVTELLGVASVETIDKQTFTSRVMTTMHVSFTFDEQVYESRSKELFDNINEVTECAARIISDKGGVILSFSHNGFDALFAPDSSAPISAAVAIRQEIISINRERSRRNVFPVTLHVTLDSGEVMLGVVGDEKRMQVTAVSSTFNTARMLDALYTRFDANILCTERMERWTGEYSARYIGKTHDGAELIRVYEIYDGDPYLARQGKKESEKQFSEGVYTLYAGEYAAAKRIFMEIVRSNIGDGVARYYLYLADRFEREPPEQTCLDC